MCYNGVIIKINLFKYKRFKDGRCRYRIIVSSHLNLPICLCQQNTDSNKEWFCTHLNTFECNIQWQKKIIMGSYKHLSTSYQLFIITEVSCKKLWIELPLQSTLQPSITLLDLYTQRFRRLPAPHLPTATTKAKVWPVSHEVTVGKPEFQPYEQAKEDKDRRPGVQSHNPWTALLHSITSLSAVLATEIVSDKTNQTYQKLSSVLHREFQFTQDIINA